jgi:hypothetical protein
MGWGTLSGSHAFTNDWARHENDRDGNRDDGSEMGASLG